MSDRVGQAAGEFSGRAVLEALRASPGGPELLELGARREDLALVGGAVRDLLLGRPPRELDVVVSRDAAALAHALAESLTADDAESARTTLG